MPPLFHIFIFLLVLKLFSHIGAAGQVRCVFRILLLYYFRLPLKHPGKPQSHICVRYFVYGCSIICFAIGFLGIVLRLWPTSVGFENAGV